MLNETARIPPISSAPLAATAAPGTRGPRRLLEPRRPVLVATSGPVGPTAWSAVGQQRPQHELHDAAVPVVVGLARRVDPHGRRELPAVRGNRHLARSLARIHGLDPDDVEYLMAGSA